MSVNEDSAENKKYGRDVDNDITSSDTTTTTSTAITAAGCSNNNNNNNNTLPLTAPAPPQLTHSLSSSYEYLSYQIEQMQQNALQQRLLDMSTAIIGDINIDSNTIKVLWKDFVFLLLGGIALSIIGYVETNSSAIPSSVEPTTTSSTNIYSNNSNPNGIIDTGFILTQPLYIFLLNNRYWNDIFAGLNSIVLLIPGLYIGYMTLWIGDYSCSFRVLSVSLLRAFCGWFTYLPPDPSYLNSYYDFPDVIHCITGNEDCSPTSNSSDSNSAPSSPAIMPFVSFFSGHVATLVVVANHMALSKSKSTRYYWSVTIHILNILQIIRLLATRGHYSIDIIIGWYVAVYVSNPAGRLGRYYSRGHTLGDILIPKTPLEAYERVIGISELKKERRMSALLKRPEVQEAIRTIERQEVAAAETSNNTSTSSSGVSSGHSNIGIGIGISIGIDDDDEVQSNTTARILQEAASKIMQEQAIFLQEEIRVLQQQYQANKQHYYKNNNDIKRTAISQQQQREVGNDDDTIIQKKEK